MKKKNVIMRLFLRVKQAKTEVFFSSMLGLIIPILPQWTPKWATALIIHDTVLRPYDGHICGHWVFTEKKKRKKIKTPLCNKV